MAAQTLLGGFLDRLACPICHVGLGQDEDCLVCGGCKLRFPVAEEIPLLAPVTDDADKRAQIAFYDDHEDARHETIRPWDRPRFHAWLLEEKFRIAIEPVVRLFGDQFSALVVCGGAGLDAEFLSRLGGEVVTSDISPGASRRALERARRRGGRYLAIVADAERLPFRDRSIDLVFVHDGLHHLPNPEAGTLEMLRVARRAIAITEPTPSPATTIAVRAGIADQVEEAGNVVRRLALDDLKGLAVGAGFEILRASKYGMFYRDGSGVVTRVLSIRYVFPIATALTRLGMRFLAPFGNKLVLVAIRPGVG